MCELDGAHMTAAFECEDHGGGVVASLEVRPGIGTRMELGSAQPNNESKLSQKGNVIAAIALPSTTAQIPPKQQLAHTNHAR